MSAIRFDAAARRIAQMAQQPGGITPARGVLGGTAPGAGVGGASFGDTLKKALEQVSATQESAQSQTNAFLRGEPVELHQVMAAAEEAGIAVEMLVEIRNKFTEAYRTVINMQS